LAADNTEALVRQAHERVFEPGSVIFDEGDPGEALFVIRSGTVELSRRGRTGRQVVAGLAAGDFFGEMSVLLGEPRTARAVATCECRALELDAPTLEAVCIDRPEVMIRLLRRLSGRLSDAERRLVALGIDELLRPVVRTMVRNAMPHADGFRIPGSLRTLAGESGLSMPEAHRALQQLLDQKLVRLVDDLLLTRDVEGLSACLDGPA